MAKTEAEPLHHVPETLKALSSTGLLLVSLDANGRPNVMTIGWGSLGIFWRRPMFIVPVRRSRYTYGCIQATGDFTVNLLPRALAEVATFCGTVSGRDHDKFAEANLTPAPSLRVRSPIIEQCVLHYECKTVHANDVVPDALAADIIGALYAAGDYHRFFFGQILSVRADDNLRGLL
jgi:flavin reductase (DIM6/NTAB) family NADH-FMN oxidoreductase RutF